MISINSFSVHMRKVLVLVFLAFLAGKTFGVHQNPLKDPNICGRPTCQVNHPKFHYKPGVTFSYHYSVNVSSLFEGTGKNASTFRIESNVTVELLSSCDGVLAVDEAELTEESDEEGRGHRNDKALEERRRLFSEALQEHTLRFSYHDGLIAEICPKAEELNWVLNFKRGLLSMLQNSMRRFDLDHESVEEDVHGRCRTKYKVLGAKETSLLVEKSKDLDSCESRSRIDSVIQSTPYKFRPNYESINLLKSKSDCVLSIDHRVYNRIECEERHLFRPFANEEAGATTVVRQLLVLTEEGDGRIIDQDYIMRRTNLLYDQVPSPKPTSVELKSSREFIKKLCRLNTEEIRLKFSDLFTRFIRAMRLLSRDTLATLFHQANSLCPTGKKHVLDALPYIGTSAAVSLMKDIILKRKVAEATMLEWMSTMALLPRPDEYTMESIEELLGNKSNDTTVVLAVSALTHTFCEQNADCRRFPQIDGILETIETMIKSYYSGARGKNPETEDVVLVYLKALGNIGTTSAETKKILKEIVRDDSSSTAVRVSAVEAHRRQPCEESRSFFESVFRKYDADAEVRIASYLQVMRCPDYVTLRGILNTLETEEVNQVGSFVRSHLNNLMRSSVPSRVEIQGLLSDSDLKDKLGGDVRKFSRNFEGSVFFEEYNVGASYDSNLIFSPNSYVPRSALLNLTVELFGESINFLEIYGRFEGFEHYLESTFGPKGPLSANKIQDKIPKLRWLRSVEDNEVFREEVEKLPNVVENSFGQPKVSLGLKVFGNELKYVTLSGERKIKDAMEGLNPISYAKKIFSGKEINYSKAGMFLDCSYVVPTSAGLPLSLNAIGTSSVSVKMFGKLKLDDFVKSKNLDLNGNLRPSVALDIVGTMSVDAYYAASAIKLKTNVYSSSAMEGNVTVRGTDLVSVQFSLPNENTEIFGAASELIVSRGETEEKQKGIPGTQVSNSICSLPSVEQTIGLAVCTDYHFSNVTRKKEAPYFILSGPSGLRIFVRKSDPTATLYSLEYKRETRADRPEESVVSLKFLTPGSQLKRMLSANLTVDKESRNLTLHLDSKAGTVLAKGKYKNSESEKYLQLELLVNGKMTFDALVSLEQQLVKNGVIYLPKMYLDVHSERVADLQGSLKWISKAGISQCDVSAKFKTKRLTSKLFGYISRTESSIGADLKLDYMFAQTKQQTVSLYAYLANRSRSTLVSVIGNSVIETTAHPNFNFNATFKFQKSAGHVETRFSLISSPDLRKNLDNDKKKITVDSFVSYRTYMNSTKFQAMASLTRPQSNLDLKGQLSCDVNGHDLNVNTLVRYAKNKEILLSMFWSHPRQALEYIEGRLNLTVPSFNPMILQGKLREKTDNNYLLELSGTWFNGLTAEAKGIYHDKSNPKTMDKHVKMLVKSPSFDDVTVNLQLYRDDYETRTDLKAGQNEEVYSFLFKHVSASPMEIVTLIKVNYNMKIYSVQTSVSLKEKREVVVEIHLDQMRDVHLAVWARNRLNHQAAGCEIKWDANRDPNQKLAVIVDLTKPAPYHYEGNAILSYPGRTINGVYNFLLGEGHLTTMGRISWSDDRSLALQVILNHEDEIETLVRLKIEAVTPFDNWRRNVLAGRYRHKDNMYHLNGTLTWMNSRRMSLDIFGDYSTSIEGFKCEFRGGLGSTVEDIPSINVNIKHLHNASKVDSNVYVMYNPEQVVSLTSVWQIKEDSVGRNLTGTVTLVSPFKGFNKGLLVSKLYLTNARDVRGVGELDLDHRKFTASVEGHLLRLSNSVLSFNVTTPMANFSRISGRFGYTEENKHLIAMVRYPDGGLGFEIFFFVRSISDFNVKFNVAVPVQFLREILLVGMLKETGADFRVGFNNLLAGFTGIWKYESVTNFEHSYKVYTPLDGFEENGFVAMLVYDDGVDFEVSLAFSDDRVGVTLMGKPKPKLLKEMGIKTQSIYLEKLSDHPVLDQEEDDDDDDEDEDDPISWDCYLRVDALIYPTVTATIDLEQKGTLYVLLGDANLPRGPAKLRNELNFEDFFKIRNKLTAVTPYESFKAIISTFDMHLAMNEEYFLEFNFDYINETLPVKTGIRLRFTTIGENFENVYNSTVHLHTPLATIPRLDIHGSLQFNEEIYKSNFSMTTVENDVFFLGSLYINPESLLSDVAFHVTSPSVTSPPVRITFRKQLGDSENSIGLDMNILQETPANFSVLAAWNFNSKRDFDLMAKIETPFRGLETTEASAFFLADGDSYSLRGSLHFNPVDVKIEAVLKDSKLNATSAVVYIKKERILRLEGEIVRKNENAHDFTGQLYIDKFLYDVTGNIVTEDDVPVSMHYELTPKTSGAPVTIKYNLQHQANGHAVKTMLRQGQHYASFEVHSNIRDTLDWDVHFQMDSSHPQYKTMHVHAKAEDRNGNKSLAIKCDTPFQKNKNPQLSAYYAITDVDRHAHLNYDISDKKANIFAVWSWILMEKMSVKLNGEYRSEEETKMGAIAAFYLNPNRDFREMVVGGNVKLNNSWSMGTNLTVHRASDTKLSVEGNVDASKSTHTLVCETDIRSEFKHVTYLVNYKNSQSPDRYGSSGDIYTVDPEDLHARVDLDWGTKLLNNYLEVRRDNGSANVLYKLRTSKNESEELIARLKYQPVEDYHGVNCSVSYPPKVSLLKAGLTFKEFSNMRGYFNLTLPEMGLNYTTVDFITETTALLHNRFLRMSWPKDNAFINSTCKTTMAKSALDRDTRGSVHVEVPLTTRHVAFVDYTYTERRENSSGNAVLTYNSTRVLEGMYTCHTESRAGFEEDTIHVELKNDFVPFGADYVHGFEYHAAEEGSNKPTLDTKHLHVYHLKNKTLINLTGELNVSTTSTGKEIAMMARHVNRTVRIWTNYDVLDQEFKQHSRLELGPDAWISYDLSALNKTLDEFHEAREVEVEIAYPMRNFTILGSYNVSESSLASAMSLLWYRDGPRYIEGEFDWKKDEIHPNSRHTTRFVVKHPSLEKNVTFLVDLSRSTKKPIEVNLLVDYSSDPDRRLELSGQIENASDENRLNYTYSFVASHPFSNLMLDCKGGVFTRSKWYKTSHSVDYKRTYLPLQSGESLALVDVRNSEVEFKRKTVTELSYFRGKYQGGYPLYTANVSAIYGADTNASGTFRLDLEKKLIASELNFTEDASQSMHVYGYIPDSRSALFDVWRDYEDIRISDVSYYLKLNHSRLIVSKLIWRPDLKKDLQGAVKAASVGLYNDIVESADYWKQYIRSELSEVASDIRSDAKQEARVLLEDLKQLAILEEDLEKLRTFLNESYYNNEFYIRDIFGFVVHVVDELSIKSHIESLPQIINELWEVMGESGKKLQKNVTWIVEMLKEYYKKAAEFINGLVHGETLDHFSEALEKLIEKYDNFIKELHVSFIKYMENLWNQTYSMIVDHWHKTLATLEPTFIEMVHYLETIVWSTSKQFLDFLYMTRNELTESQFFMQFTNFTHDLDKFYRDMTGNDTIINGIKYGKIVWEFLKEKYFAVIPFAGELNAVFSEIVGEIKELLKLPTVSYLVERLEEVGQKIGWFVDYFDLERKFQRFVAVIHSKLTEMKRNALEVDNKYREAKTLFVFEPSEGVMYLEQKLPMSWHAFNETPNFEEISEYKYVRDLQSYFSTSKVTFSYFYYNYKPLADPTDWLPPFQAQALIAGAKYYVTFDRTYYDFRGACTYLLASDFVDRNFSVAVSYHRGGPSPYEILVLVDGTVVHVDPFSDAVHYGAEEETRLPVQIGNVFLYQEADVLVLENLNGFRLQCNFKFDVCSFEISGWYFGKTAGLWGTMNNEPKDDLLTSDKTRVSLEELENFAESWAVGENCAGKSDRIENERRADDSLRNICESFFDSKVSPFESCLPRVPPKFFSDMCLESESIGEVCTAALAYMEVCSYENTPMRIPDVCVECELANGTKVPEGKFISLNGDQVPQSADVVFLVEAKSCNADIRTRKSIDLLIEELDRELAALKITKNRYSAVVFGGDGVFYSPRSLVVNGTIFADHEAFPAYFDRMPVGNGSADIFEAVTYATKLIFQPGASKTFVLLPCSRCYESDMKLDHAMLNQLLLENDIVLHVLMNEEFQFQKQRIGRILFGVDQTHAFTKKDSDKLTGDATLRKLVKLPKASLGTCAPLALETRGSVFSSRKLTSERKLAPKKAISVFAKRVAKSAVPGKCKTCECTAHNTGVSYMECFSCSYPNPTFDDYNFDEDEMLSLMQPSFEDITDYD